MKIHLTYERDVPDVDRCVAIENVKIRIESGKRVIYFDVCWGGFWIFFRKRRSFKTRGISDLKTRNFRVIPGPVFKVSQNPRVEWIRAGEGKIRVSCIQINLKSE